MAEVKVGGVSPGLPGHVTNLVEVERVEDPAAVRAFDLTRKDMPCLVTNQN